MAAAALDRVDGAAQPAKCWLHFHVLNGILSGRDGDTSDFHFTKTAPAYY